MLSLTDPDLFANVARSILNSVADSLAACDREVPDCKFLGFARPSEASCPDLVAWLSNIRAWDGETMDSGLREGRLMAFNAYAFDVTIRLGRCYLENDETGNTLPADILDDWSTELYRDAQVMYINWVTSWRSGNVTELGQCDPLSIGTLIDYKEGGCAGWEFTVTVGVM